MSNIYLWISKDSSGKYECDSCRVNLLLFIYFWNVQSFCERTNQRIKQGGVGKQLTTAEARRCLCRGEMRVRESSQHLAALVMVLIAGCPGSSSSLGFPSTQKFLYLDLRIATASCFWIAGDSGQGTGVATSYWGFCLILMSQRVTAESVSQSETAGIKAHCWLKSRLQAGQLPGGGAGCQRWQPDSVLTWRK